MDNAPDPGNVHLLLPQDAPPRRGRGIYLLPNLLTTSALFAGFYAIVSAIHAHYEAAAIAIFLAMVLDGLDGRIARMTNTESAFVFYRQGKWPCRKDHV